MSYDAAGDLASVRHLDGTPPVAIPRALDAYGRPASAGGAAYGYDAAGRPASVSSGGLDIGFAYLPGTDLPSGWSCGGFRRTVACEVRRDLVAAVTNAFGGSPVSSECADDETGLVCYNWRHYDPVHGVWLGRDPIGVDGGANLYAFCGNDPIENIDERGCSRRNGGKMKGVSLTYVSDKEGFDWAEFWAGLLIGDDTTATVGDFNPNSHLTECECVKNLTVIMHGYSEGNDAALVYWGKDTLMEDVLSEQLSDMFSEVKFCDKCTLELRSCYIGKNHLLKKRLEQKTGCEVKLYENRVTIFGREEK